MRPEEGWQEETIKTRQRVKAEVKKPFMPFIHLLGKVPDLL